MPDQLQAPGDVSDGGGSTATASDLGGAASLGSVCPGLSVRERLPRPQSDAGRPRCVRCCGLRRQLGPAGRVVGAGRRARLGGSSVATAGQGRWASPGLWTAGLARKASTGTADRLTGSPAGASDERS